MDTLLLFLVLSGLGLHSEALAEGGAPQCSRSPTAYNVGEVVTSNREGCEASAKIHAIAFECGVLDESFEFRNSALEGNNEKAAELCDEFCSTVHSNCEGFFEKKSQCGFVVPMNKEIYVGKNVIGCAKNCKGEAFHYCSIYHGSYLGSDPNLFTNVKPNCHCRVKPPSKASRAIDSLKSWVDDLL